MAHETLLSIASLDGRGALGKNGYMYVYGWVPLLFTWNYHNLVNQLSVQFSRSVMSDSLSSHGLQHARPPCPSSTPGACSNLCPLSRWCHPTISSSVTAFSSLQSFPASGSFLMSHLFTSGGQIIGVSASTYYHKWNRSPVQVWCRRKGTQGPCTGMILRDGMWRTVGGGFSVGDTCTPMADLHQRMAKTTTIL